MTTKQTIIEQALDDISFNGDYDSSLLARGLRTMDQMVYEWLNQGIDIGYLLDDTSELTDDSGLLFQNLKVVRMNLAVELAEHLDLMVPPAYAAKADMAFDALYSTTPPIRTTSPYMPLGAGQTRCYTSQYLAYQNLGTDEIEELTDTTGVTLTDDSGYVVSMEE